MLIILSDYLEWSLRMMIKSDFEKYVSKALDKFITDYHTFTRIMLFCDYLWAVISEDQEVQDEKNE